MPEKDVKIDYSEVLKQLERDVDGLDERRQALLASIAGIRRLVANDGQDELALDDGLGFSRNGADVSTVRLPIIPPGHFRGKTTTEAYRELVGTWPGHYTPPQIADLLAQGGIDATTRTGLIQAIHSVLKRERDKARRDTALRSH